MSTLNDASFTNIDHTRCCAAGSNASGKKKTNVENESEPEKKRKRKNSVIDPDYNPIADNTESISNIGSSLASVSQIIASKMTNILKSTAHKMNTSSTLASITETAIVQNDTSKAKAATSVKAPLTNVISSAMVSKSQFRPIAPAVKQITPQFPPGIRVAAVRPPQQQQSVLQPSLGRIRPPNIKPVATGMKHEWFEKTVRSAARVNSNLSYTLTQLNKAQASADSIEALAVVHNKLQEILSNSINSLIQIRKNLRTEFIAGIKTIRFPPKPNNSTVNSNDDDVILVTPGPNIPTLPPPLISGQLPSLVPLSSGYCNATSVNNFGNSTASQLEEIKACNSAKSDSKPKMYLKVRSFSQLQTVPAECITIPDDPTPLDVIDNINETGKKGNKTSEAASKEQINTTEEDLVTIEDEQNISYNLNHIPNEELQKMSSVKVNIVRSDDVDKFAEQYAMTVNENGENVD